jgi:hypothetical protein
MDASTIVQRIIDLGMNENAPDTDLQNKALGWLNNAYKEAYNIAATVSWPSYLETATVTITAGTGTLPFAPRRVLSVVDNNTKRVLKQSDLLSVIALDPSITTTGNPARWYLQGETTIKVFPLSTTTLSTVLMRRPADLTLVSTEADIKVPPHHHELLIWSALTEAMMYERGFGNDALIQVANARKIQLLDNYSREMFSSIAPQRVALQDC